MGVLLQGAGVVSFLLFHDFGGYIAAAVVTGLGTAMAYPTLQAFVSDVSAAHWRASSLGVYRFWRDLGYAIGALGGASQLIPGVSTRLSTASGCSPQLVRPSLPGE